MPTPYSSILCNVISTNRNTGQQTIVNMEPVTYLRARSILKNTLTRPYRREVIEDAHDGKVIYYR